MADSPSSDSIENEAECEDTIILIPPDLPPMEWAKDTVINIPPLPPAEWPECCIYRVPKKLRKVNDEAYTPKFVSIGPFHHCREELKDMEMQKLRYLKDFLDQTGKSQQDLLKIIEDDEEKIRHSCSEDCGLKNGTEFVQMILLDAIFIIELFLKTNQTKEKDYSQKKEKDYILRKPLLGNGILHDLILLENQLPFFVLENLYKSAGINDNHPPFLDLFCNYFTHYKWANYSFKSQEVKQIAEKKVNHFTDLVRLLYCSPNTEQWSSEEGRPDTRFSATKLDDAGFNFKGVEDHSRPLLAINLHGKEDHSNQSPASDWLQSICTYFCCISCFPCICLYVICYSCVETLRLGGPLEVPQLVIDYETEVIFRNLMALEQCHYPFEAYICSYVWLLDRLIDTEKDVDLLVKKKVIVNNLGNNAAVATLINELCNQINVATTSSCNSIARELNKHYDHHVRHLLATLKREYFPNIFRGTATLVGLIVLGFTLCSFVKPFVV